MICRQFYIVSFCFGYCTINTLKLLTIAPRVLYIHTVRMAPKMMCCGYLLWFVILSKCIHTYTSWVEHRLFYCPPPPPPQYLRIEISLLLYIISHVMIAYQICYKKYITFIFLRYASDLQDILPMCSLSKYFNLALNIHRMCTYT